MDDFDYDAAQAPHVNCRYVAIMFGEVEYVVAVGVSFLLIEIVYHFRRHVLRRR